MKGGGGEDGKGGGGKKRSRRKEQRVKAGDEEGIKETFAIKNAGI